MANDLVTAADGEEEQTHLLALGLSLANWSISALAWLWASSSVPHVCCQHWLFKTPRKATTASSLNFPSPISTLYPSSKNSKRKKLLTVQVHYRQVSTANNQALSHDQAQPPGAARDDAHLAIQREGG